MNRASRPVIFVILAAAIGLLSIASDFFGVIEFAGITKELLANFLRENWPFVLLAALSISLLSAISSVLITRRAARIEAESLKTQLHAASTQLEASEDSLRHISEEAAMLKTELDDHTAKLRETFTKYQDLTDRCDAIVIQFSAVIEEFVGSGFFIRYNSVTDTTEARAILNALTNPIRAKLVNFQELTKRALAETKVAFQESEKTSISLGELKKQLSTALADKQAAVGELLAKRAVLDTNLRKATSTIESLRADLHRCLDRQEGLKTTLKVQEEQLRTLEAAKTETELAAHFGVRVGQLESEVCTLSDLLKEAQQENQLLAKENACLERLKLKRRR